MAEEVVVEEARHLRHIARDLRVAGDISLVLLSDDGVRAAGITLADEIWLIASRLDPDHAFEDTQGPDEAPQTGRGSTS